MDENNLQQIFEDPVVQQLAEKAYADLDSEVKLPYILKDKILMSPGVWNNFYYSPRVIKTIFKKTNWDDPKIRALFLDHIDDRAAEWIGEVLNPRLVNGNVVGDLAILDKPTAIKLAYGAKFGVSPKVVGEADYNKRMYDGYFENFSIVINPAVKTTFLNSEIKIKNKGGENMPETKKQMLEEEAVKSEDVKEVAEESKKEEVKESTSESTTVQNVEELAEKIAEILAKKKYPYPKDEELKKKKYPYPEKYPKELMEEINKLKEEIAELKKKPEEMNETEQQLSAYTDFIRDYLKKHPGATIKDAAKEWGKQHNELEENTVTVEDLQTKIGEIVTEKMSEFGVKPIRIAQKFIDPKSENIDASELDMAMFNMIKEGIGI